MLYKSTPGQLSLSLDCWEATAASRAQHLLRKAPAWSPPLDFSVTAGALVPTAINNRENSFIKSLLAVHVHKLSLKQELCRGWDAG